MPFAPAESVCGLFELAEGGGGGGGRRFDAGGGLGDGPLAANVLFLLRAAMRSARVVYCGSSVSAMVSVY
jgi:hypothetical protein